MAMEEPVVERRLSDSEEERDENRLAQFGYKQELKRDWGLAHNFGVSFSIIVRFTAYATHHQISFDSRMMDILGHASLTANRASSQASVRSSHMG
jgi:adenylate kinase